MLKWRNTYPEVLLTRIEDAIEARLYLLRQSGPTGFHVKEHDSDKKYKVEILIRLMKHLHFDKLSIY